MPKLTPAQAIEILVEMSPCPIVHSMEEAHWYRHRERSRSAYFCVKTGRWANSQDFILMNEGPARHWNYVQTLAHEVGHALDAHGLHPAQDYLPRSRQGRYREELPAVAMETVFCQKIGIASMKSVKRRIALSQDDYLGRYTQGGNPSLGWILRAMKDWNPIPEPAP